MGIPKGKIENILIQIQGEQTNADGSKKAIGLLTDAINLGLRRRLKKIQSELLISYDELKVDRMEIDKIENEEERIKELTNLLNEEIQLKSEKVLWSEIDKIENKTENKFDYDFEIIGMIAQ